MMLLDALTLPLSAPTSVSCSGCEFRLVLQTDEYAEETSWEVTGANGATVAQGNNYSANSRNEIIECLPSGTDYTFAIRDTYGDGICCEFGGNYFIPCPRCFFSPFLISLC